MKRVTPLILLLFTLSGVSGLVYELVWIRLFSHLLGGTSYAISTVLAAFMGGLALGSRHYGRRADHCERPLLLYAKLEVGIALLSGLVTLILFGAPDIYAAVGGRLPGPLLALLRVLITGALLLPPTFLMGGTLPVLSRVIVTRRDALGRGMGLLYAVNTFGAVLGCFLAGFTLIATLGLGGSTLLALLLNLAIAAAIWLIDRGLSPLAVSAAYAESLLDEEAPAAKAPTGKSTAGKVPTAAEAHRIELDSRLLAWVFALSGFASLGYELYWTRGLQHFLGNSTYAFSAMLTTFLLGLAAGGWLGGRLADRVASPARLLGWVQLAVGTTAALTVLLLWRWLTAEGSGVWLNDRSLSWSAYLSRRFLLAFLVMAPTTLLTGMTFPLVNRIGIRSLAHLGRGVGWLYFANTLGAIAGSLAAGFLVLPLLGARAALLATALLSAALGVLIHLGRARRGAVEPWLVGAAFAALLVATPILHRSGRSLLSDTQSTGDPVLFDREDHAGETRVYRKRTGDVHMSVDGHHIGGTEPALLRKEKILAHLPMLLRPDAKKTLAVGLGSGVTLGTLALYDEIEQLACVEIVPGVVEGARFFDQPARGVLRDPRLELHVGDGVQYLLTTRQRFDIISSDSKLNPEYAGNAPLLSEDYTALCRDRLTENGVMVQWIAIHLPLADVKVITRSFAAAFPHVALYWYDPYNLILAGSKAPLTLDLDAARRFLARPAIAADLEPLHLADPYLLGTLWVSGNEALRTAVGPGPLNTWARPRLEFTLGRNFRSQTLGYHEEDVLRWLRLIRQDDGQGLRGAVEPAVLRSHQIAAAKLLEGFAMGSGIQQLEPGIPAFQAGLAACPGNARIAGVLAQWERLGTQIEEAYAGGRITDAEGLSRVGLQRREAGRHAEALAIFEQALALRPGDPDLQYNRLLTLRDLGRLDAFNAALDTFAKQFPRDARAHSLRGRLLADAGMMAEALVAFDAAVAINPENPTTQNNRATALARLGRYAEAARGFEAVCALQPSYQNAAFFAAASHSMADAPAAAARWARFCLDKGLAQPEAFRTDPLFANLRASAFWDGARGEPRAGAQ